MTVKEIRVLEHLSLSLVVTKGKALSSWGLRTEAQHLTEQPKPAVLGWDQAAGALIGPTLQKSAARHPSPGESTAPTRETVYRITALSVVVKIAEARRYISEYRLRGYRLDSTVKEQPLVPLQGTRAQGPALTSDSSQLPAAPATGKPEGVCTSVHVYTQRETHACIHVYIHIISKKLKKKIILRSRL